MERLSKGQEKALDAIKAHIALNGMPPTRSEIAAMMGVDVSWAHRLLIRLRSKGYISLAPGKARGIRIINGA